MRKTYSGLASLTMVFMLAAVPAFATKPASQGKPATAKGGPKTTPASMKGSAPKGIGKPAPPKAKAPTIKPAKALKPAKAPKTAAAKTKPKTTTATTTTTGTTRTTSIPPSTGTWTPNNAVAQKLSTKPNLLARIKASLPAGIDLNAATAGFKNFGQFVAATNVSSNLGIDFGKLKASMTGTNLNGLPTGQPTLSLGQSIQKLKPGVDSTTEARRAETLANRMIADSGN